MKHRIELTARAQADLQEGYQYMPARASAWRKGLLEAAKTLAKFPERCGIAPESCFVKQEIRQLRYGSYRILFLIAERGVYILHIRHTARQSLTPEEMEGLSHDET